MHMQQWTWSKGVRVNYPKVVDKWCNRFLWHIRKQIVRGINRSRVNKSYKRLKYLRTSVSCSLLLFCWLKSFARTISHRMTVCAVVTSHVTALSVFRCFNISFSRSFTSRWWTSSMTLCQLSAAGFRWHFAYAKSSRIPMSIDVLWETIWHQSA